MRFRVDDMRSITENVCHYRLTLELYQYSIMSRCPFQYCIGRYIIIKDY